MAAVTAHNPTQHGTWAVAYLVLVGGVAQIAVGVGQALHTTTRVSPRVVAAEFTAFNLGNAGVLLGTLLETTWLVDAAARVWQLPWSSSCAAAVISEAGHS